MLGWGVGMHQAMLSAKAADHHGASGIVFSPATRVIFLPKKYHRSIGTFLRKLKIKIMGITKPLLNL